MCQRVNEQGDVGSAGEQRYPCLGSGWPMLLFHPVRLAYAQTIKGGRPESRCDRVLHFFESFHRHGSHRLVAAAASR